MRTQSDYPRTCWNILYSSLLTFSIATGLSLPALSFAQSNLIDVNTITDTTDITPGDGECLDMNNLCSLRAAIQEANATAGMQRIRLARNLTYTLTLAGAGEDVSATGDLDITDDLVLIGRRSTVDAANLDRAFDVAEGVELKVIRLDVTNGSVTNESGAGYRSAGSLTLLRSSVAFSEAQGMGASGGAVFNDGGSLEVNESEFTTNSAERAGGAIEANEGTTRISRSEFVSNSTGETPGNGGGFHLTGDGTVTILNSTFSANSAFSEGGGAWNSATGTMVVRGSSFTNNNATGMAADNGGGALFNDGGVMRLIRNRIVMNSASNGSASGGGILNNGGNLRLTRTKLLNNGANRAGGAIETVAGTLLIRKGLMKGNSAGAAPGNGGALHVTGAATTRIIGARFATNTATAEGGGLWNSATGTMNVINARVNSNSAAGDDADQGGGGLFNDGGVLNVISTRINNNRATGASGSGGGILNNQGTLLVSDSNLAANTALRAGGGIETNIGTLTLRDVVLQNNVAGDNPGNGGGLHLTGAAQSVLTGVRANGNDAAAEGGGIWNSSTGTIVATRSRASGNSAPLGADLFNDGGTFLFNGMEVAATP